ncbi:serine hydrolase [Bacillus thuringiensis]|uniref:serine hydrolase n=1 Tax=Bacillus thuringiensis TaxID=1428 RepID=UPI00211D46DF|nr:serine hydrolase [Bacillus thuringiensis]
MAYAWHARHGLTAAQFQVEFNSMVSQGFRLIDISGYGVGGVDLYTAIWEQSPGPQWEAYQGLLSADHQSLFTTLTAQGYRPVRVSGYEVADRDRYASLWQKTAGPDWRARHGLTPAQFQEELNTLSRQGFQLIDLCVYTVAGQPQFAAIWDEFQPTNSLVRYGLTSSQYQAELSHWTNQGFLLWRVSGYEVAGQNFYAAIWIKGQNVTWFARHGLSAADYQSEFNSMVERGFRLVKVNGYPLHGEAQYTTIWHKPYLSDNDLSFIHQTVTNFMNNHGVPGATLALTYQERLVFAQGYGLANRVTNELVTTNHLFRIASVSKPITSVAVFKLIEAGQLNMGDRVFGRNAILSTTYGTKQYNRNIEKITVQHLLEHTSGWVRTQDPMFSHFDLNQHQLITWMLDNESQTYVPGQTYDYLNFGYLLLGRIIEQVSGMSYADYVRQHVLAPCGITDMHIAGDTLADRRANEVVYYPQSSANPYSIKVSRMDSHGGWLASAKDLVRFLVRVDRFAFKADILNSQTLATMYTTTTAPRIDGSSSNYAKGWGIHPSEGYSHNGDITGTASIVVRTHHGYCWTVLVNSRNDAQLDKMRADLYNLMWTIIGRIKDWPAFDLL